MSLAAALLAAAAAAAGSVGPQRVAVEPFVTLPADVRRPEGLASDPATGELYVGTFDARTPASARNNQLLRYAPDGTLLARRSFGATPLTGIEVADGKVYILNFGAAKLQRMDAAFNAASPVEDVAELKGPAPNGLVFDKARNLYVSDSFQGAVYRIERATTCAPCSAVPVLQHEMLTTANRTLPFGANGLAFSADESVLYVNNAGDHRVLRMAMPAGPLSVLAESVHGADGLLFHGGLLWVAANQADAVLGIDEHGLVRVRAGEFAGIGADGAPLGLLFPASTAVQGPWMVVANLALPLTAAVGDEWEEQVTRWTLVRFRIPQR